VRRQASFSTRSISSSSPTRCPRSEANSTRP
jgi:hypothetical protein